MIVEEYKSDDAKALRLAIKPVHRKKDVCEINKIIQHLDKYVIMAIILDGRSRPRLDHIERMVKEVGCRSHLELKRLAQNFRADCQRKKYKR